MNPPNSTVSFIYKLHFTYSDRRGHPWTNKQSKQLIALGYSLLNDLGGCLFFHTEFFFKFPGQFKFIHGSIFKRYKNACNARISPNLALQIRSDQSLSRVRLFATPWIAARQASLSITNSRSSLRLTSIESVMPLSHLILCRPLLLLPPIPPSIRIFS